MNFNKIISCFLVVSTLLFGCKPNLDEPRYSSGEADFSRYVALGGNGTAGFSDSAVSYESQLASLPAMLASRFELVGGGAFIQPLVKQGNGLVISSESNQLKGKETLVSYVDCNGKTNFKTEFLSGDNSNLLWIGSNGPFNNMGVPGVKSFQLYSQFLGKGGAVGNYYYNRFASDTGATSGLSSTIIGDASLLNPTFFTLWLGNNDVYSYALSGGKGLTSGTALNDITPIDTFTKAIDFVIKSMTSNGAKGAIANIPDIIDIPFFNSIPYNGLVLSKALADSFNVQYGSLGFSFIEGNNAYVIAEPSTNSIRQIKSNELILRSIPNGSLSCGNLGTPGNAIPADWVLDSLEFNNITQAINSFNSKLKSAAIANKLVFVDLKNLYKNFKSGYLFNGVNFNADYLKGGIFSLDGIHPNQRGYALIANEFVRMINSEYKCTLPDIDVNSYNGIIFP